MPNDFIIKNDQTFKLGSINDNIILLATVQPPSCNGATKQFSQNQNYAYYVLYINQPSKMWLRSNAHSTFFTDLYYSSDFSLFRANIFAHTPPAILFKLMPFSPSHSFQKQYLIFGFVSLCVPFVFFSLRHSMWAFLFVFPILMMLLAVCCRFCCLLNIFLFLFFWFDR